MGQLDGRVALITARAMLGAAAILCGAQAPAPGQSDAAKMRNPAFTAALTCGEWRAWMADGRKMQSGTAILWLDGLYAGRSGADTFPEAWLRTLAEAVGTSCGDSANADRTVIDVIGEARRKAAPPAN